jgi:hypothetical protein
MERIENREERWREWKIENGVERSVRLRFFAALRMTVLLP